MKKRYCLYLLIVFFASCIKDESDLLPSAVQKPVINALVTPALPFIAYADLSKGILDTSSVLPYAEARLAIYENETLVDSMMYIDSLGLYIARQFTFPQTGKCYSVKGSYGTYPMLSSGTSCVPLQVPIQQLMLDTAFSVEDNHDTYRVGVQFGDLPGPGDLYQLSLYRYRLNKQGVWELSSRCVRSTWNAEYNDRELCGGLYFSDSYPGSGASELIWLDSGIRPSAVHHHDSLQLIVELKHASAEYYQYALTYAKYLRNKGSIFSQPAPIYSNISNGYGIFGTLHSYRDTIVF